MVLRFATIHAGAFFILGFALGLSAWATATAWRRWPMRVLSPIGILLCFVLFGLLVGLTNPVAGGG